MDPDMVRQQEEAEREALARQKLPLNVFADALVPGVAAQAVAESAMAVEAAPAPALAPHMEPHPQEREPRPAFSGFGKFLGFGFGGAMLGGGLGLAAAFYFDLSAEQAKLAVAGAAAFMGMLSAMMSLFAGRRGGQR